MKVYVVVAAFEPGDEPLLIGVYSNRNKADAVLRKCLAVRFLGESISYEDHPPDNICNAFIGFGNVGSVYTTEIDKSGFETQWLEESPMWPRSKKGDTP